jgi:peptide/nickel transport system substrate-binding protein
MQDSGKRKVKTVFCLGAAFALALLIAIACGGATEPDKADTATPAEMAPVATKPAVDAAKATTAPVAEAPATAMGDVNPGKVTMMTGSFGNERFDAAYGDPGVDTNRQIHGFLVDSNVVGGTLTVIPGIATEWSISDDLRSTTFTIREGVKFHDGTEVEMEDVLWSLQHYVGPQAPDYATASLALRYGRDMEKIELGPAANQVTVTSTKTIPEFASYGSQGNGGNSLTKVMPKREHLHDEAEALAYDQNPIAAGIIKLVKHDLGEKMVFERFDDYFHQPDNGFPDDKRIQFSTMEFVLAQDESTRIAAIRAGEADMGRVGLGARDQIEAGGGRLIFSPEARAFQVQPWGCFNPEFPCHDKRVRQALSYAVDKEKMQNQLYGGPQVMQVKGFWVVTDSTLGYSPDLAPYPFDPEKARQLLAEAGYPGGRGFGTLIVDTYISPFIPFMVESAQLAAEFWQTELGLDVEVRQHDKTGLGRAKVATPRDFDGHLLWGGQDTRSDAAGITKLFYLNRDSDATYYYHSNPEIWDLGDIAVAKIGRDGEAEVFNTLYKRLLDEAYDLAIGYINIPWGVGPRIATWEPYPLSQHSSAFHTITLK